MTVAPRILVVDD
ncbi:MAG: hypothetical protein KJ042_06800, partial [Deltaproteobacteria bacterium]|nr:hypothetical protein [Deltaproteobacteria bacterium]